MTFCTVCQGRVFGLPQKGGFADSGGLLRKRYDVNELVLGGGGVGSECGGDMNELPATTERNPRNVPLPLNLALTTMLFVSRDACSDSVANFLVGRFMGHRTIIAPDVE